MKKKKQLTFLEMVEEERKNPSGIVIKYVNEPNIRLMAEGAINIWYHQTYDIKEKKNEQ
jgi:hypothetical protein